MKVGIDSSLSMFAQAPGAPAGMTVIEDVRGWLGKYPDFVIRPTGPGGAGATPLTTEECGKLHDLGIGITTYYNGSPLNSGKVTGSYDLGKQDAENALAELRGIGIWPGTYPCADIEETNNDQNNPLPVLVTPDWVQGWTDGSRASEFAGAGMVYGGVWTGSRLASAILGALQADKNGNVHRLFIWCATWKYKVGLNYQNAATLAWNPQAPSVDTLSMVRMDQISGNDFNGICDQTICQEDFYNSSIWLPGTAVPVASQAPAKLMPQNVAAAKGLLQQAINLL